MDVVRNAVLGLVVENVVVRNAVAVDARVRVRVVVRALVDVVVNLAVDAVLSVVDLKKVDPVKVREKASLARSLSQKNVVRALSQKRSRSPGGGVGGAVVQAKAKH